MPSPLRTPLSALLAAGFVGSADVAHACPRVTPSDEAIVAVKVLGVGSVDVLLQWYADGAEGWCFATLDLPLERLSSLRFVPRPEDLAEAVGTVAARRWAADSCEVGVFVTPETTRLRDWESYPCVFGSVSRDGARWVGSGDDDSC
jgi:hypothetical protein